MSREERIASALAAYLARGDRLASDVGLLTIHEVAGVLVVELGESTYEVTITVSRPR
jgi:hypothetical protein